MKNTPKGADFEYPLVSQITESSIHHKDTSPELNKYIQLERDLDIAGEEGLSSAESKHVPPWTLQPIKGDSDLEKRVERTQRHNRIYGLEPTELAFPTKKKVVTNYIFSFLGMGSEAVTYFLVCYYGLSYLVWEAALVAGAALCFAKFITWGIKKYIKDWIKTSNAFKRNLQKGVFICLTICIFLNVACLVVPRAKQLQDNKKLQRIETLKAEIKILKQDEEDLSLIPPKEKEILKLKNALQAEDSTLMKIAKYFGIFFLCSLTLACSAILFGIAEYHHDAFSIDKKMKKLKEIIGTEKSRIKEYPKKAQLFTRIKREQIRSTAKINYLLSRTSKKFGKTK